MRKLEFPENFIWGVATAAFQIEGTAFEDGKGESIWDRLCRTPGKVKNMDNGDVACDHYHRYSEDIKTLKQLGVKNYRFSVSWPRIFPDGWGEPNQKGLQFYRNLIDELLENGIEPAITIACSDIRDILSYEQDPTAEQGAYIPVVHALLEEVQAG